MILEADLRPFAATDGRGRSVHATVDIEGRSSIFFSCRLAGFGDALVFPPVDAALASHRRQVQRQFFTRALMKTAGILIDEPTTVTPGRTDGLWRTTCLEVFGRLPDGRYAEFNLAPSGLWAAYIFDGYRSGMAELDGSVELIEASREGDEYILKAWVNWSAWPHVQAIGLSAVLETVDAGNTYWALAHPSDKPDFHHPDSFALQFDRSPHEVRH